VCGVSLEKGCALDGGDGEMNGCISKRRTSFLKGFILLVFVQVVPRCQAAGWVGESEEGTKVEGRLCQARGEGEQEGLCQRTVLAV
jgi:hypothetical protein